jgi:hypothetical protein
LRIEYTALSKQDSILSAESRIYASFLKCSLGVQQSGVFVLNKVVIPFEP